jgi:hypothetical protein
MWTGVSAVRLPSKHDHRKPRPAREDVRRVSAVRLPSKHNHKGAIIPQTIVEKSRQSGCRASTITWHATRPWRTLDRLGSQTAEQARSPAGISDRRRSECVSAVWLPSMIRSAQPHRASRSAIGEANVSAVRLPSKHDYCAACPTPRALPSVSAVRLPSGRASTIAMEVQSYPSQRD